MSHVSHCHVVDLVAWPSLEFHMHITIECLFDLLPGLQKTIACTLSRLGFGVFEVSLSSFS